MYDFIYIHIVWVLCMIMANRCRQLYHSLAHFRVCYMSSCVNMVVPGCFIIFQYFIMFHRFGKITHSTVPQGVVTLSCRSMWENSNQRWTYHFPPHQGWYGGGWLFGSKQNLLDSGCAMLCLCILWLCDWWPIQTFALLTCGFVSWYSTVPVRWSKQLDIFGKWTWLMPRRFYFIPMFFRDLDYVGSREISERLKQSSHSLGPFSINLHVESQ